ncbi:unnamed protein product [Cyprideis torosa]|uniref:Uncharacterized protein n=1 Tax=Cyprideis torosa TaxID=163714 RepID=A0A7R8ZP13_9CRUS|nr:unnamed protein product [Cyprideis torosa]CAG0888802.1 unnamed protein product [Cyprideis torosa]
MLKVMSYTGCHCSDGSPSDPPPYPTRNHVAGLMADPLTLRPSPPHVAGLKAHPLSLRSSPPHVAGLKAHPLTLRPTRNHVAECLMRPPVIPVLLEGAEVIDVCHVYKQLLEGACISSRLNMLETAATVNTWEPWLAFWRSYVERPNASSLVVRRTRVCLPGQQPLSSPSTALTPFYPKCQQPSSSPSTALTPCYPKCQQPSSSPSTALTLCYPKCQQPSSSPSTALTLCYLPEVLRKALAVFFVVSVLTLCYPKCQQPSSSPSTALTLCYPKCQQPLSSPSTALTPCYPKCQKPSSFPSTALTPCYPKCQQPSSSPSTALTLCYPKCQQPSSFPSTALTLCYLPEVLRKALAIPSDDDHLARRVQEMNCIDILSPTPPSSHSPSPEASPAGCVKGEGGFYPPGHPLRSSFHGKTNTEHIWANSIPSSVNSASFKHAVKPRPNFLPVAPNNNNAAPGGESPSPPCPNALCSAGETTPSNKALLRVIPRKSGSFSSTSEQTRDLQSKRDSALMLIQNEHKTDSALMFIQNGCLQSKRDSALMLMQNGESLPPEHKTDSALMLIQNGVNSVGPVPSVVNQLDLATRPVSEPPDKEQPKRGSFYDNIVPLAVQEDLEDNEILLDSSEKVISRRRNRRTDRLVVPLGDEEAVPSLSPTSHPPALRRPRGSSSSASGDDLNNDEAHSKDTASAPSSSSVIRWHSFQRGACYFNRCEPDNTPFAKLSTGQILLLRKLATLRITSLMEKHCASHKNTGFTWDLPKLIRKIKQPVDFKDKLVFGVPLQVNVARHGQPLPAAILRAVDFLRHAAKDAVGLFRRSGVRSRIEKLKQMCEQGDFEKIKFEGQQPYDVGDMVKQYFRDLPDALLSNKLSPTFLAIFQYLPDSVRSEALSCALLLLPDENREALYTLLSFLAQVAYLSPFNQMTATNLAVCFAPSLFHLGGRSGSPSPKRNGQSKGVPDHRDLTQQRFAHECLTFMIEEHSRLFSVPEQMMAQCEFSYMDQSEPVAVEELLFDGKKDWRKYMNACVTGLLKEARDSYSVTRNPRWISIASPYLAQMEISYKKVPDEHPLRLWRVACDVDAPPEEVLRRILKERTAWDWSIVKVKCIEPLDREADVFHYVTTSMEPHPQRDFVVLRFWKRFLPRDCCALVETSISHAEADDIPGSVRGVVLASRFLMEPTTGGRTRVVHLARIDLKGRSIEWYSKNFGHIMAQSLSRLRESFIHGTDLNESHV